MEGHREIKNRVIELYWINNVGAMKDTGKNDVSGVSSVAAIFIRNLNQEKKRVVNYEIYIFTHITFEFLYLCKKWFIGLFLTW